MPAHKEGIGEMPEAKGRPFLPVGAPIALMILLSGILWMTASSMLRVSRGEPTPPPPTATEIHVGNVDVIAESETAGSPAAWVRTMERAQF